jgi:HlyD family type I secretion membrane fusion protein
MMNAAIDIRGAKPLAMSNATAFVGLRSPTLRPEAPNDSCGRAAMVGWTIIAIFFGGFGTWAATAPLNGAVVAQAVVKVEGNRKSVQHLDGGIVKELRVKEGDRVSAGDVLIVLDDTQARAEYEVLSEELVVLRATEVRLLTELDHGLQLVMPDDLKFGHDDPYVRSIWNGQVRQFESRAAAMEGQRNVIQEKINQLRAQIVGAEAQLRAFDEQRASVKKEADSVAPLVERGLVAKPRIFQLERTAFSLEGQVGDTSANIAKFRQAIAEQAQQIAQLDCDRMTEVTKDLRETQGKLLEVRSKRTNAQAVLSRMEIKSPYTGKVVALNVFSVGGVITRGDKILDIVPEQDALTVEAQVAVEDISDVHPNMRAEVHLTAYKQRTTPVVHGDVVQVSADRLTDSKSDKPYYVASIHIYESELAKLPQVHLYPGMPATVMLPTIERTALDYLIGPLKMSFNQAFRQK